jgi:hypothetical protein
MFDPSDTIPPSTMTIDPMVATGLDPPMLSRRKIQGSSDKESGCSR